VSVNTPLRAELVGLGSSCVGKVDPRDWAQAASCRLVANRWSPNWSAWAWIARGCWRTTSATSAQRTWWGATAAATVERLAAQETEGRAMLAALDEARCASRRPGRQERRAKSSWSLVKQAELKFPDETSRKSWAARRPKSRWRDGYRVRSRR
jgi:hypothetical protein